MRVSTDQLELLGDHSGDLDVQVLPHVSGGGACDDACQHPARAVEHRHARCGL